MKSPINPTQTGTALIVFSEDGKIKTWSVGCMAWEKPEALKEHLEHWKPKAKFISVKITPTPQKG